MGKGCEGKASVLFSDINFFFLNSLISRVYRAFSCREDLIIVWRHELGHHVLAVVIEDLRCSFHPNGVWQLGVLVLSLLVVEVAASNQEILELKHLEVDVPVVLQELVFVSSLHQFEELVSQTVNTRLNVNLHVLECVCCFNQARDGSL